MQFRTVCVWMTILSLATVVRSLTEPTTATLGSTVAHPAWISRIISHHILDYNVSSEVNPQCTRHFKTFRQHLSNFTTWAVQMFDSSDLVPTGLLVGDNYKLGNFDECLNVKVPKKFGISSQYCLATFKFNRIGYERSSKRISEWERPAWDRLQASKFDRTKVPKDFFNLAFCLPSSCAPEDLQSSLQTLLEGPMRAGSFNLTVTVDHLQCTSNEERDSEPSGTQIVRYFMMVVTFIFLICSGIDILLAATQPEKYDVTNCSFDKATGLEKWILPFSLLRNGRLLLKGTDSPDDHKILHGSKLILMILVIVAHRVMEGCVNPAFTNWNYYENRIQEFSLFFVGLPVVDVFFCISGFLTCTSLVKQLDKNTFNIWTYVANKLIRVLPPYMFILACTIFILPTLANGPMWKTVIETEVDYCRKGWWTNLLFINNYYNPQDYCLLQTWYIAADMHFFVVGSVMIYFCWRWSSRKTTIIGLALFISAFIPFVIVVVNQYDGVLKQYYDYLAKPRSHEAFLHVYMKSHARAGPYVVGIAGAFILNHLKKNGHKFTKVAAWAGALSGVVISVSAAAYGYVLYNPNKPYNAIENGLYAGIHHHAVAAGFMIIVIVQIISGFGVLDVFFLAHDIFAPGSRLSYWAFLLNIPVILYVVGSYKTPQYMTYEQLIYSGQNWGDIVLIYFISIYCYLIIEAPINHFKPKILNRIRRIQSAAKIKIAYNPTDKK
nr:PREDICTED: nose resistant to fluoxetine protein 6-like [Bemisia tabaci]